MSNDWGSGFTSNTAVTDDGTSTITGWQVQWRQNSNSTVTSSWNANVTGSNPYTACNVDWNGAIAPGASQSFGVQGNGEDSTAAIVSCTAAGANTPSLLSSAASSRAVSSVIISPSSKSNSSSSTIILSSSKSSSSLASTDSTFTLEENATGFCGVE